MSETNQLSVPAAVKDDARSFELLRVWVAQSGQHVSLLPGVWEDPAAWGIMLADLAKHVAISYEQNAGFDPQKTLLRIQSGWDAELGSPTDHPSGQVSR